MKSFTLIELLIVTTIIFILSGLSLASYNGFTEEQKLKNEARKFVDVLELAKKKAMTADIGNYDDDACSNFFGTRVDVLPLQYTLKLCCQKDCNNPSPTFPPYSFAPNIRFINTTGNITFSHIEAKISGITSFTLKNTAINKCLSITISSAGVINLNETLFSDGC